VVYVRKADTRKCLMARLEPALYRRVRIACVSEGVTLNDAVTELLKLKYGAPEPEPEPTPRPSRRSRKPSSMQAAE
jgi:hypothetical protein